MNQRILFVIESLFPLGSAQQLKLLADALVESGCDIHVAVLGEKTFEPTAWTDIGINVAFLNGDDKTPLNTFRDGLYVTGQLRRLIRRIAPEIVHAWCGPAELLALLATENIPFTQRLRRFRFIGTELSRHPPKRFVRQSIESRLADRLERMIVPHQSVKDDLLETGFREDRIEIVPNAATPPELDRLAARSEIVAALNLPKTAYLAGAVAPLCHRTRLKDLIWATDLLTVIRDDFHFLIIGRGTQLKRLQRFASLTESASHVHFLGEPGKPERLIGGLDFFWHSHLHDPLPGNLLAAMANGIPAISVYGPGTEEIVRHQETAFGVNFGARDEFARWTKFLIEQTEPAEKLAWQGQSYVQSKFDKSKMIDRYKAIYD